MRTIPLCFAVVASALAIGCASTPPAAATFEDPPPRRDSAAREEAATTAALTLDVAIKTALANNPELAADYARFEALLLDEPQVSSLSDPMLMVSQEQAFRGPGDGRENMVTLSQTFPWFGKRGLRGAIARQEAMEALEEYRAAALDVRRDVARAWHSLRYQEANRELALREQELLRQSLDATAAQYRSGQGDRAGLLRTQTEIALIDNELPGIEGEVERLRREIDRLVSVPGAHRRIDDASASAFQLVEWLDQPDALLATAIDHRPELARWREAEDRTALGERLARADYYPDFTLGVGYVAMGERPSGFAMLPDDRTDSWQASVGVNLPLPNARRRAAVRQAELRSDEARLRGIAAEDRVIEELFGSIAWLRALERQHAYFTESIVPLAEEAHAAVEASYRSGRANFVELLDAQRALINARREILRIERDHALATTELERALGMPLDLIASIHGEHDQ